MLLLVTAALAFEPTSPTAQAVVELEPLPTRAGFLRLGGPTLDVPDAAEALAWRLEHLDESLEVQQAVARALADAGSPEILMEAIAAEEDPAVRGPLLDGLRKVDGEAALALLVRELDSPEAENRCEAARILGYREDGGPALVTLLDDESDDVRAIAARGIGWIGYEPGFEALVPLRSDASAEVARHAERSLDRIDAKRAAQLP